MTQTGELLHKFRLDRGLSKYAVAAACDVDHGNIFKIEHGQRFPTADTIGRLQRAYTLTQTEKDALMCCLSDDLLTPYRLAVE